MKKRFMQFLGNVLPVKAWRRRIRARYGKWRVDSLVKMFDEATVDKGDVLIRHAGLVIGGPTWSTISTCREVLCEQEYAFEGAGEFVAVDIGMNIGVAALYLAGKESVTHVYGFEPFAPTYRLARENVQRNPALAGKITTFNIGLGDADKTLRIPYHADCPQGMRTVHPKPGTADTATEEVKVVRASTMLESLLARHDEKVLLKIDCEGAEAEILPDLAAAGLLERISVVILEWHFGSGETHLAMLRDHGFVCFPQDRRAKQVGMIYAVRQP